MRIGPNSGAAGRDAVDRAASVLADGCEAAEVDLRRRRLASTVLRPGGTC